jgi:hypothetical protein
MVIRSADFDYETATAAPIISVGQHGKIGTLVVNGLTAEGAGKLIDDPENTVARTVLWKIDGV